MTSPMMSTVKGIYKKMKPYEPEQFLNANDDVSVATLEALKSLYDYTKIAERDTGDLQHLTFTTITTSKSRKKRKLAAKSALTEAPLRQLITESFDSEQIWEEVQLQNGLMYENLVSSISKLLAHANTLQSQAAEIIEVTQQTSSKPQIQNNQVEFEDEEEDSEYEFEGNREKSKPKSNSKPNNVYSKSEVDDKFFNLAQMTEFLEKVESQIEAEDKRKGDDHDAIGESDSDESIDMFAAMDDEEDEDNDGDDASDKNIYYNQFFDRPLDETVTANDNPEDVGPNQIQNEASGSENEDLDENEEEEPEDDLDEEDNDTFMEESQGHLNLEPAEGSSSSEDEADEDSALLPSKSDVPSNLSTFEKRRKKIDESIAQMEQEAMQPKGWQFQGEVTAEKRPENSLLEENLVFDHLLRQAPEITVKTNLKLEDIMKQRIKDQAWDDVERKAKPVETPFEYKNKLILDSEKSKQSLAQVYEQEYINKKKAEDGQNDIESVPEDEAVIQKGLKTLFGKLDALSNFHYTPKPASSDIKIITNLPSIAMEEVAPVSVSDATLLAPQEIQAPVMFEIKGTGERDSTDKKRERRQKKKKQHLKRVDREERSRVKGLGLRNVKLAENILDKDKGKKKGKGDAVIDAAVGNSKELKSSKAFFDKLQDKVQTQIKDKLSKSKKSETKKSPQAKRFKL